MNLFWGKKDELSLSYPSFYISARLVDQEK